jgi:hypothetical protein
MTTTTRRHKWALSITAAHADQGPAARFAPYMMFTSAGLLGVLAFLYFIKEQFSYCQISAGYAGFLLAMGFILWERRAFSELSASKDKQIEKLQAELKSSGSK